ncbi:MAG: hypothetical protein DMG68_21800 [Acidobacteria bacterium]|nr:MAG: hypothetical protein DMG68_21800 [Acidobacteriota bacterium]
MVFGGWRKIETYSSGQITVWSKEDVPPARKIESDAVPAPWEGLLWGTLPIGSSILAILLILLIPETARARDNLVHIPSAAGEPIYAREVRP